MLPIFAADQNSAIVFGPIPGSFSNSRMPVPYFATQFIPLRSVPCATMLWIFAAMLLPMPANLLQARSVAGDRSQVDRRLLYCIGRDAVAANAKAVRSVDLHQIGGLSQQAGNCRVFHAAVSAISIDYSRGYFEAIGMTGKDLAPSGGRSHPYPSHIGRPVSLANPVSAYQNCNLRISDHTRAQNRFNTLKGALQFPRIGSYQGLRKLFSARALLRCAVRGVPEANHCVCLGTFLALDDVKLHIVALFQCFVAV